MSFVCRICHAYNNVSYHAHSDMFIMSTVQSYSSCDGHHVYNASCHVHVYNASYVHSVMFTMSTKHPIMHIHPVMFIMSLMHYVMSM